MSATNAPPVPDGLPLRQRVIAASVWSLAGYAASQAIRFGSNLVMTRLLMPKMFGVMAIATIVMVGLGMFSDLGLGQSIVQNRRGDDPAFLNTAWALQILRGLVLWGMALAVGLGLHLAVRTGVVPTDSVYADPSLPWVIPALSFSTVIGGFVSTKVFEARRRLALRRITQIELGAQAAGLAAMLAWSALDRSVWVLVAGGLTASIVSAAAGHLLLPGTPSRWQWDRSAVAELVHFGKWIFASSVLGFFAANSDRLLLGSMMDATTFGIAAIAFLLVGVMDQVVGRITGGIALSALSEVVRKNGDLRAAYYRLHAPIAGVAYFSAGFFLVAGQALVAILYDSRYAEAGWMVQIIAATLLMAPFSLAQQAYLALGKPELHSRILAVRLIALLALVPSGYHLLGLPGTLWGTVLSQFATLVLFLPYNMKIGIFDARREAMMMPALLLGMGAGALLVVIGRSWSLT